MDRRSFLRTSSLIGAAAALAPKELLANSMTKAKQHCLFGVEALGPQQQAYPVTTPCPAGFGAAVVPTNLPPKVLSLAPKVKKSKTRKSKARKSKKKVSR